MLFHLGLLEFDGHADAAIELGLHLAEGMLDRGQHFDAGFAARNVLLRPGLPRCGARAGARDDGRCFRGARDGSARPLVISRPQPKNYRR